jgi:hypothetical protein
LQNRALLEQNIPHATDGLNDTAPFPPELSHIADPLFILQRENIHDPGIDTSRPPVLGTFVTSCSVGLRPWLELVEPIVQMLDVAEFAVRTTAKRDRR